VRFSFSFSCKSYQKYLSKFLNSGDEKNSKIILCYRRLCGVWFKIDSRRRFGKSWKSLFKILYKFHPGKMSVQNLKRVKKKVDVHHSLCGASFLVRKSDAGLPDSNRLFHRMQGRRVRKNINVETKIRTAFDADDKAVGDRCQGFVGILMEVFVKPTEAPVELKFWPLSMIIIVKCASKKHSLHAHRF
jgi:hypothetical protein